MRVVVAGLVAQHEVVERIGTPICHAAAVMDVQWLAIEQISPTDQATPGLPIRHHPMRRRPRSVAKSPPAVARRPVGAEARVIRRCGSFDLHVAHNWRVRYLEQGQEPAAPTTILRGRCEHPAVAAHRLEVAVLDPVPPLGRVSALRPTPEYLDETMVHVIERPLADRVLVVGGPVPHPRVEVVDDGLCGDGLVVVEPLILGLSARYLIATSRRTTPVLSTRSFSLPPMQVPPWLWFRRTHRRRVRRAGRVGWRPRCGSSGPPPALTRPSSAPSTRPRTALPSAMALCSPTGTLLSPTCHQSSDHQMGRLAQSSSSMHAGRRRPGMHRR